MCFYEEVKYDWDLLLYYCIRQNFVAPFSQSMLVSHYQTSLFPLCKATYFYVSHVHYSCSVCVHLVVLSVMWTWPSLVFYCINVWVWEHKSFSTYMDPKLASPKYKINGRCRDSLCIEISHRSGVLARTCNTNKNCMNNCMSVNRSKSSISRSEYVMLKLPVINIALFFCRQAMDYTRPHLSPWQT